MFLGMNSENFEMQDLSNMRAVLEKLDDDKLFMLQGAEFQKPSTIFLIALLLGWERFWLDDTAMSVVKIITFGGCGIWWLVDVISAKDRAKKFNMKKFVQITSFL